jgi:hypothetical protein
MALGVETVIRNSTALFAAAVKAGNNGGDENGWAHVSSPERSAFLTDFEVNRGDNRIAGQFVESVKLSTSSEQ